MSDLAEEVLLYVGQKETVDSLLLSETLCQDHQKIVGAIKSIQVQLYFRKNKGSSMRFPHVQKMH